MSDKKLQVFLSSTYDDLIDQRLVAIDAILASGHIPAAMEQFVPGDDTAWRIIRRWIDDSDAFILLLGGRYGSIKPRTGKSYVELEYDYAVEQGKPYFSLVLDEEHHEERVRKLGLRVDERKYRSEYDAFRERVMEKLCKLWANDPDIRSTILQKLPQWASRDDLTGWMRADEVRGAAKELEALDRENEDLRGRLDLLIDDNSKLRGRLEHHEGPPPDELEQWVRTNANLDAFPRREFFERQLPVLKSWDRNGEEVLLVWDSHTEHLLRLVHEGARWDPKRRLNESEQQIVRKILGAPESPAS